MVKFLAVFLSCIHYIHTHEEIFSSKNLIEYFWYSWYNARSEYSKMYQFSIEKFNSFLGRRRVSSSEKRKPLPMPFSISLLIKTDYSVYVCRKATRPKASRMMPPPDFHVCLQPCVTLTFDLLTPKVDRFMSITRGLLLPIGIKISLFVFIISRSQVW